MNDTPGGGRSSPAPSSADQAGTAGWFRVLAWAAYLACSWTWCIGMFLPVLLVRDFGVWGFVVFAVPNVFGAAAMGWVVRSPEQSRAIVERHRGACVLFSLVTVAFQTYFVLWMMSAGAFIGTGVPPRTIALLIVGLIGVIVGFTAWRRTPYLSILTWCVSVVCAWLFVREQTWSGLTEISPGADPLGAAWLAPVCVFGFALCPYLDLTFHLARQRLSKRESRRAFGLGFGVLFFAMIVFTLLYARACLSGGTPAFARHVAFGVSGVLGAHILIQLLFTIMAHVGVVLPGLRARPVFSGTRAWITAASLGAALFILPPLGLGLEDLAHELTGLDAGEVVYRLFMTFYGLVFPAYVWLCMIPTRAGAGAHAGLAGPLGRLKLRVWLASVALAAPAFWMGFMERQTAWLAPGLFVVLIARVVVMSRAAGAPAERAA